MTTRHPNRDKAMAQAQADSVRQLPQTPQPSVTIADPKWAIARDAGQWAAQQHPAWLTLWCVLIAIGALGWFGGRYIVNVAVPGHLASIKEGYEELWQKHLDDKRDSESRNREHLDQAVTEMRNSNRLLDSLVREFILREQRREQVGAATVKKSDGG